jgi:hypothetical protein
MSDVPPGGEKSMKPEAPCSSTAPVNSSAHRPVRARRLTDQAGRRRITIAVIRVP